VKQVLVFWGNVIRGKYHAALATLLELCVVFQNLVLRFVLGAC
jgi:hypothetical protein